jgi:hypothetical protein
MNATDLVPTHITGVICHGLFDFWTYVDIKEYKHDSNMTMNLLLKTLFKVKQKMVSIPIHLLMTFAITGLLIYH